MTSLFIIIVKSNGNIIGRITPEQFRKSEQVPASMFLQTAIEKFNSWKAEIGEPERAEIAMA